MRRAKAAICAVLFIMLSAAATAQQKCTPEFHADLPVLNKCADSQRISVALVGDVLLHAPLQRQGYATGFRSLWSAVEPFFQAADVSYANFEGAAAAGVLPGGGQGRDPGPVFDNRVYSSYPMFNYHPSVIDALKASGIDIVSTANNHALDRLSRGVDATIAALADRNLAYTGTIKRGAAPDFIGFTPTKLGTLAWVACTYSTNGVPDPHSQVLGCYNQTDRLLAEVRRASAMGGVVGVIVVPHWGVEYAARHAARQTVLSRQIVQAGALAVVGTHPHTVQPWEEMTARAAQVPVIYSTGNFVSGQSSLAKETGLLTWLELCRAPAVQDLGAQVRQRLVVAKAGWVPLRMQRQFGERRLVTVGPEGPLGPVGAAQDLVAGRVPGFDAQARITCQAAAPLDTIAVLQ